MRLPDEPFNEMADRLAGLVAAGRGGALTDKQFLDQARLILDDCGHVRAAAHAAKPGRAGNTFVDEPVAAAAGAEGTCQFTPERATRHPVKKNKRHPVKKNLR